MKVAVASSDGTEISKHFGRSAYFIIYDVNDGKIGNKEMRPNRFTAHAMGNHSHSPEQDGGSCGHSAGQHSHAGIVAALQDCETVLCYGMGRRAAVDLMANNIAVCVLPGECTPDQAVEMYIQGRIVPSQTRFCAGHNH